MKKLPEQIKSSLNAKNRINRGVHGRPNEASKNTTKSLRKIVAIIGVLAIFLASGSVVVGDSKITPEEAAEIAAEAYTYGYPMVQTHKIWWAGLLPAPIGGFIPNEVVSFNRVFTPDDTNVVSPNNDTPYSPTFLDLRAEAVVLSVPAVSDRYYSFQFLDYFTNDFAYVGTRTTGREAGNYLIVGPDNKGITKKVKSQFDGVITSPSQFVLALGRTQLFCTNDDVGCEQGLADVAEIQAQYKVTLLSEFPLTKGKAPAPKSVPDLSLQIPLGIGGGPVYSSPTLFFFRTLNWALAYELPFKSEKSMARRFAKIGVGPGERFNLSAFSPEVLAAMQLAIESEDERIEEAVSSQDTEDGWSLYPVGVPYFGTPPTFSDTDYDFRALAANEAIWVNDPAEALYYFGIYDSSNENVLTGANDNVYEMHFPSDAELPDAEFFWSLTMYQENELLVDNCIDRYSLGSGDTFKKAPDDSTTIIFSNDPPEGTDCDNNVSPNWLPAPDGGFYVILRVYGPSASDLNPDSPYLPPPFELVEGSPGALGSSPVSTKTHFAHELTQPFETPFETAFRFLWDWFMGNGYDLQSAELLMDNETGLTKK